MLTIQDYTLSHNRVNALKDSGQLRDYNKDVPMFAFVFAATAALTALAIGWSVSLRRKVADLSAQLVDRQGKLRAFAVELIRAEEEQRTRIARELHDGLGQMMTAVNIELQVLKDAASDELRPRVDDVRALSAQVMGEMRRISQELRPAILDEMGLAEAVRALVSRMARLGAVAIEVQVAGDVDVLPADAAIACYRMVQEALNNVVRHSQARRAVVELSRRGERLAVSVTDDGKGIPDDATGQMGKPGHFGLMGLQERIHAIGGTFAIRRPPAGGTRLQAELPVSG